MEIKVNGGQFITTKQTPKFSKDKILSLGHVKGSCDRNAFMGEIAEVILYDAVLSNGNVKSIEDYLLNKYWEERPYAQTIDTVQHRSGPVDETVDETVDEPVDEPVDETVEHQSVQDQLDEPVTPTTSKVHLRSDTNLAKLLDAFNPDDVFTWTPPSSATANEISQWKTEVSTRYREIQSFQFGGNILHTFIREKKSELNAIRNSTFANLLN